MPDANMAVSSSPRPADLFHEGRICFMKAGFVSRGPDLFHEGRICFTEGAICFTFSPPVMNETNPHSYPVGMPQRTGSARSASQSLCQRLRRTRPLNTS